MSISILIAEDDPLLRRLVERILADSDTLQVIGDAADGLQALQEIERLQPDVLLLDLNMPKLSGMQVLERLGNAETRPAVLVLSTDEDEETQLTAARAGARGFLPKSQAAASLIEAVERVAAGEFWFSRRVSSLILSEYPLLARRVRDQDRPTSLLTDREKDVLIRVARGMTNSQIAADLSMSLSTVKTHVQNIFHKFDLPNRTEAAVFAVRHGLLEEGG